MCSSGPETGIGGCKSRETPGTCPVIVTQEWYFLLSKLGGGHRRIISMTWDHFPKYFSGFSLSTGGGGGGSPSTERRGSPSTEANQPTGSCCQLAQQSCGGHLGFWFMWKFISTSLSSYGKWLWVKMFTGSSWRVQAGEVMKFGVISENFVWMLYSEFCCFCRWSPKVLTQP